jgi:UDP:flavonoid glycosyltransferase YjiC (YdhE family)
LKTIALLHSGEMGAAVGACLIRRGHRVLWASSGRSAATASRAKAAGLEGSATLERAFISPQAEIYRELERYKDPGSPPSLDEVIATLRGTE